ncbi:MAG: ATP-binding cassette domain-containing protein [Lachnospiraceae bacterium]|nr:ATP-binding cassette domain-containing protein [Lachnospiraceae bacterium]
MLELKDIRKEYSAGDLKVEALKGISLQFRKSEFVSILGPSGCGKTTMLNLIGGLDKYTDGDLIINGKSTKDFKDRDWDSYRNHSVGFVFQSYNLIPHQSVLQNVELALSLSGVSKTERRKRAKEALEAVGLGDQLKKKPAEMSGGQMQRVAIARALVNNPDIILADEPTGALDTQTSVQVMNILKEVAKDRLVIMVTHNPDLANEYSTRIIRMLDGVIKDDSAPLTEEEVTAEKMKYTKQLLSKKREKKPSMSLWTSFGLSLKNLFTKKGRTILTSFAGSIGIIGIALIFAVSHGMTEYINTVQEETLSSYPLTLEAQHLDMGALLTTFMGTADSDTEHEKDAIYQKGMLYDMINSLNTMEADENDLNAFKKFIEKERSAEGTNEALKEAVTGVQYTYDLDLIVYTKSLDGNIIESDTEALLQSLLLEYFGMDLSAMVNMGNSSSLSAGMSSMSGMGSVTLWQEMLPGDNGKLVSPLLEKQYDVIYGSWPTEYNEIVVVVDENNEVDDMALYALGLKSKEDIDDLAQAAFNGTEVKAETESWSFEQLCDMDFRVILNSDCYTYDDSLGVYLDLRESQAGLKYLYDNGTSLKISGIIRPKEDAVASMLTGNIGYTSELTKYVVEKAKESESIKAQLDNPTKDIFNGLPFKENAGDLSDSEKVAEFKKFIDELDERGKAKAYVEIMCIPAKAELDAIVEQTLAPLTREDMQTTMATVMSQQMGMAAEEVNEYLGAMPEEDIVGLFTEMIVEQTKMQYAAEVQAQLSGMSDEQLAGALMMAMTQFTTEQMVTYHDEVLEFSESSYENNLRELGYVDLETPASINLYASSFENKDVIEEAINDYNNSVDELEKIAYTDYVGLMMSSITTIINSITYVLISFVAISLIVSSIMIGVITLISVQERTKEIGILRAIGASKKNVSSMFNAETVIIGFTSGTLGVLITYLLCIPINMILHAVSGINNLNAILPLPVAGILVGISILLTLFAGIIPSRSAAKKDPVVALRTE